jgi:addiction module HigA family antidote
MEKRSPAGREDVADWLGFREVQDQPVALTNFVQRKPRKRKPMSEPKNLTAEFSAATVVRPAERFHPGGFVREEMGARNWSIGELSEKSSITQDVIYGILGERESVTQRIAEGLSRAFGSSAGYWLNLQTTYDGAQRQRSAAPARTARTLNTQQRPARAGVGWNALLGHEPYKPTETRYLDYFFGDIQRYQAA